MVEQRLMTQEEKDAILLRGLELKDQGKEEEALENDKQVPMPAYLAKLNKDLYGLDFLLGMGWNLAEAVQEYGPEFLSK